MKLLLFLITLIFSAPVATLAQSWPAKPVRIVVPSPPAGAIDVAARVLAAKLPEYWGQAVIVDNRPGASMIIGSEAVMKAAPDGYTLLAVHDGGMVMNTLSFKSLPYNPQRDFTPLSQLTSQPLVLLVNAALGIRTVKELIAHARAYPGKLNQGSGGMATGLALELFNAMANTQIVLVPYKGTAQGLNSVIAGETQVSFIGVGSAAGVLKSDKLRVLAITSGKRSPRFPDLPTLAEAGVPGYDNTSWVGLFGPAGMSSELRTRITADTRRALGDPAVREMLQKSYLDAVGSDGEELARTLAADTEKWTRLVREQNIKLSE
ncbi:MAG: Bug family tripartite tricarboxylate transporter substrate binding protein [Burkholderiales bacterium]